MRWLLINLAAWVVLFWAAMSWTQPAVTKSYCEAGACFTDPAWFEMVLPAALLATAMWATAHVLYRLLRRVRSNATQPSD